MTILDNQEPYPVCNDSLCAQVLALQEQLNQIVDRMSNAPVGLTAVRLEAFSQEVCRVSCNVTELAQSLPVDDRANVALSCDQDEELTVEDPWLLFNPQD